MLSNNSIVGLLQYLRCWFQADLNRFYRGVVLLQKTFSFFERLKLKWYILTFSPNLHFSILVFYWLFLTLFCSCLTLLWEPKNSGSGYITTHNVLVTSCLFLKNICSLFLINLPRNHLPLKYQIYILNAKRAWVGLRLWLTLKCWLDWAGPLNSKKPHSSMSVWNIYKIVTHTFNIYPLKVRISVVVYSTFFKE